MVIQTVCLGQGPTVCNFMALQNQPSKHSYTPKADHPWKQYANRRKTENDVEVEDEVKIMALKNFLKDLVDNWDTYKIPPANFEDREYVSLARMNTDKQAEWIIGFIKKHWMTRHKGALILE